MRLRLTLMAAVLASCQSNSSGTSQVDQSDGASDAAAVSDAPSLVDSAAIDVGGPRTDAAAPGANGDAPGDVTGDGSPDAGPADSARDATATDASEPTTAAECIGRQCQPGNGTGGTVCLAASRAGEPLFCLSGIWVDTCPGCVCMGTGGECFAAPFPDGFDCASDVECQSGHCKNNMAHLGKCGR